MRIIIVASSPYQTFNKYEYLDGDYLIGIEDGAYQIIKQNLRLDLAIGDFDTTNNFDIIKQHAVILKQYSPIKDEIDLELAFKYIISNNFKGEIIVYNACMGRMDHELITIKLLKKYHNLQITLINETESIKYITTDVLIEKGNKRFSLIPFENVTLEIINAKYSIPKTILTSNDVYTSSNKTLDDLDTIIKIYDGGIYLIKEL